jgi:hypothetical protein
MNKSIIKSIIKSNYFGVFYKQRGKWTREPYQGSLWSETQVKTFGKELLSEARNVIKKPVKLKRQYWQ